MTQEVAKAFEEQSKINFMLAKDKSIEVDGYSGFVFTAKSGRPLMPNGVNSVLYNIVDAYNKTEVERAKKDRKADVWRLLFLMILNMCHILNLIGM